MTVYYTSNDRFAVSILMALGLHAFVLLGIGFVLDFRPVTHPLESLDVVLVNWQSESAPDEADFLAQASQQGGGESTEASRPSQEYAGTSPSAGRSRHQRWRTRPVNRSWWNPRTRR